MKTSEKKSLFTEISEEKSATVCGGFGLSITLSLGSITTDPNDFLNQAAAYGVDLDLLKKQLNYLDAINS